MASWLVDNKDLIDVITKVVATFFAVLGGGLGLYQYFKTTRLKAAETLLKMEEEFRIVLSTYEEIEDDRSYERLIKPVLEAEGDGGLNDVSLAKLTSLDRCLRFLYLCSVLNETLRVDRALGVEGGALRRAYYHYIAILLPEESKQRPELLAYTRREYPQLTAWVKDHASDLRAIQKPRLGSPDTRDGS
jgi:hypothetical protein